MNESQNTWNEMNRNQINTHDNWKPRLLVVGAAAGAFLGLGAAYLLARSSEEQHGGPPEVTTGDLLKLGWACLVLCAGLRHWRINSLLKDKSFSKPAQPLDSLRFCLLQGRSRTEGDLVFIKAPSPCDVEVLPGLTIDARL